MSLKDTVWAFEEEWYSQALALPCPFWRRRASDLLDSLLDPLLEQVWTQIAASRKEAKPVSWTPLAWRSIKGSRDRTVRKDAQAEDENMTTVEEVMDGLKSDWKSDPTQPRYCKGYYISGRVNVNLYAPDCFFDGPDPDMPVHGLRKYANAASQLFCPKQSFAELLDMYPGHDQNPTIVAHWRLQGRLRLPWKPTLPIVYGTTTYHLERRCDGELQITRHVETWDNLNAWQAFAYTFLAPVLERGQTLARTLAAWHTFVAHCLLCRPLLLPRAEKRTPAPAVASAAHVKRDHELSALHQFRGNNDSPDDESFQCNNLHRHRQAHDTASASSATSCPFGRFFGHQGSAT